MRAASGVVALIAGRDPGREISGGHSAYVLGHAYALRSAGIEPHIFCVGLRSRVERRAYGTVHTVFSPLGPARQVAIADHAVFLARAVERFAANVPGPLVIHSFGVWGYAGLLAAARLRRRGGTAIPVLSSYTTYEAEAHSKVATESASGPVRRAIFRMEHAWIANVVQRLEAKAYRGSAAVFYNYESVRRLIVGAFGSTAPLVRTPYTTSMAFMPEQTQARERGPGHTPVLVAISRHDPRKGIEVLIEALAILQQRALPFRAVLIGGGPLLAANRNLATRLGLSERVVAITGVVPEIRPFLAHADIYVLPSRREQSGSLALIEALQAGLPVVASACDGIPEDVEDGVQGILVPPGDAPALAEALAQLLTSPARRSTFGAAARVRYEERFGPDAVSAGLVAAYRALGASL